MGMTPEERAAYMKRYYEQNKAYLKRYKKAWYERNREDVCGRRRARYYTDEGFREWDINRHRKGERNARAD